MLFVALITILLLTPVTVVIPAFYDTSGGAARAYAWTHVIVTFVLTVSLGEVLVGGLLTLRRTATRSLSEGCACAKHVVFLPFCKEPAETLRETLDCLTRTHVSDLWVVLGAEAIDEGASATIQTLTKEFEGKFGRLTSTCHTASTGSLAGKHANAQCMLEALQASIDKDDDPFVTIIDADTHVAPFYFAAVERDAERIGSANAIWQAPIVARNIDQTPPAVRYTTSIQVLWQFALISTALTRMTLSSYTLKYSLLRQVGGWHPNYIDEDFHMRVRSGILAQTRVRPVYEVLSTTAIVEHSTFETIKATLNQIIRHSMGLSTLTYAITATPRSAFAAAFAVRMLTRDVMTPVASVWVILNNLFWALDFWRLSTIRTPFLAASVLLIAATASLVVLAWRVQRRLLMIPFSCVDILGILCFPVATFIFGYFTVLTASFTILCTNTRRFRYIVASRTSAKRVNAIPLTYIGLFSIGLGVFVAILWRVALIGGVDRLLFTLCSVVLNLLIFAAPQARGTNQEIVRPQSVQIDVPTSSTV